MNIDELKETLETKRKENAIRVREAAEISRLKASIAQETSEGLFEAKVRLEANGMQTAHLQRLIDECVEIIQTTPIQNLKTRAAREWAGSHRYGFGTQVDLMYQLATGILYACAEHKALMLEHTGLNLELLEEVVTAFGTPTYYSRKYHAVVEAKPYDVSRVYTAVEVMQSQLNVVIDTTALTENVFKKDFERNEAKAEIDYNQAAEAIDGVDFAI